LTTRRNNRTAAAAFAAITAALTLTAARPAAAQARFGGSSASYGMRRMAASPSRPRFLVRPEGGATPRVAGALSLRVGGVLAGGQGGGGALCVAVRVYSAAPGDRVTQVENTVLSGGLPTTFDWDTERVENGWYELQVVVMDLESGDEVATDRIRVEVNNGFRAGRRFPVRRTAPAAPAEPVAADPQPTTEPVEEGSSDVPAPAAAPEEAPMVPAAPSVRPAPRRSAGRPSAALPALPPLPRVSAADYDGVAPDRSSTRHDAFVRGALAYRGRPYVFGATGQNGAYDCSSLMQHLYRGRGVRLPRTAAEQFGVGRPVSRDALRAGDLLFFRDTYKPGISHVGMYIGDGRILHAANRKQGVRVDRLDGAYFTQHWAGARRVL
jgi:cell wall-associated NlpC family hydrolase